jgi:uncharacterized protein
MEFEFDSRKSHRNKLKHGIDFEEARKLWDDIDAIETISSYSVEERILRIGKIESRLWTPIFTHRGNNSNDLGSPGTTK